MKRIRGFEQGILLILVLSLSLLSQLPGVVAEEEDSNKEEITLKVVATLGSNIKDTEFYKATYQSTESKKLVKNKILVKIPRGLPMWKDSLGKISQLKEGDVAHIFAKPEERNVTSATGDVSEVERFLKESSLIIKSETPAVDIEYENPKQKSFEWCKSKVQKSGKGGLIVEFIDQPYKVLMAKKYQIILRQEVPTETREKKWKKLIRKGAQLVLRGKPSSEKPPAKKSKAETRKAFEAVEIILINKKISGYYGRHLKL